MNDKSQATLIIQSAKKSLTYYSAAIDAAADGNYAEAEQMIKEGLAAFDAGHSIHHAMLKRIANGEDIELNVLLVHAEDILLNAETLGAVARKFIIAYKCFDRASKMKEKQIVQFGKYKQGNTIKPIDWIVLDEKNGARLLISKHALNCMRYHNDLVKVTWEDSDLRKWLNSGFIDLAFDEEEKKRLQSTHVKAEPNPHYGTPAGNDTVDKVFLLSIPEAKKYFFKDEDRICLATESAKKEGMYARQQSNQCWWWLRTPGSSSSGAALVDSNGHIQAGVRRLNFFKTGVRPACWVI